MIRNLIEFQNEIVKNGSARYSLTHEPVPIDGFLACKQGRYCLEKMNTLEDSISDFISRYGFELNVRGNFIEVVFDKGFYSIYLLSHYTTIKSASTVMFNYDCRIYDMRTGVKYDIPTPFIVNNLDASRRKLIRKVKFHRSIPWIGAAIVVTIVVLEIIFLDI